MVRTRVWLVPPLVQPRSEEFPPGVVIDTLAVPGAEITVVVRVTCTCWLLRTCVASDAPLMTTTEDATKWLPFTVSKNPCCTWANVTVSAEREAMDGEGRALPHRGFSALQP